MSEYKLTFDGDEIIRKVNERFYGVDGVTQTGQSHVVTKTQVLEKTVRCFGIDCEKELHLKRSVNSSGNLTKYECADGEKYGQNWYCHKCFAKKKEQLRVAEEKRYAEQLKREAAREKEREAKLLAEQEKKQNQFIRFYFKNGEIKEFKGDIDSAEASYGWVNVYFNDGRMFSAYRETYETNMELFASDIRKGGKS